MGTHKVHSLDGLDTHKKNHRDIFLRCARSKAWEIVGGLRPPNLIALTRWTGAWNPSRFERPSTEDFPSLGGLTKKRYSVEYPRRERWSSRKLGAGRPCNQAEVCVIIYRSQYPHGPTAATRANAGAGRGMRHTCQPLRSGISLKEV